MRAGGLNPLDVTHERGDELPCVLGLEERRRLAQDDAIHLVAEVTDRSEARVVYEIAGTEVGQPLHDRDTEEDGTKEPEGSGSGNRYQVVERDGRLNERQLHELDRCRARGGAQESVQKGLEQEREEAIAGPDHGHQGHCERDSDRIRANVAEEPSQIAHGFMMP